MKVFISILLLCVFQIGNAQVKRNNLLEQYSSTSKQYLEQGNFDSSLFYLNKALSLAHLQSDSVTQTKLYRELGHLFEIRGDYKSSLTAYYKSIQLSYSTRQVSERALCYLGLSNVNFRTANTELALTNSIEAAQIFKQISDTSNFINASALKAQVYLGLKKFDESLNIYKDLLSLSIKTSDSLNIVYNTEHIGGVYSFMNKYDTAIMYFKKAMALNQNLKNPIYDGIIYGNIGEMNMRKGEYQEALKNLNTALAIEQKYHFRSGIIFLYYTLGETYDLIGNSKQASVYFQKSLQLIEETGEIREKSNVYRLMSENAARIGKYKEAFSFSIVSNQINDSLLNLSNGYKIEEIRIKNDIEKTEHAYLSLLNEKSTKEQELLSSKSLIRMQLLIILLVGLGFICSVGFTVYFFRSRRELNKANSNKKLLFSIIGHDLKGPIGNIKQIVEVIQSPETETEVREKFINLLHKPAETSLNLLDDLLTWSKSNDKEMVFNPGIIHVSKLVYEVTNLLSPISSNKKIQIKSAITDNVYVYADINHFSTILRNLIANAIKFTPENGTIEISHSVEKKWVKIMISDTGVGIDQQSINKIMDSSSFDTTFGTNREKGSGLGLNICKELVKKNGGKFGIESAVGKGSTFYFTVPQYVSKS